MFDVDELKNAIPNPNDSKCPFDYARAKEQLDKVNLNDRAHVHKLAGLQSTTNEGAANSQDINDTVLFRILNYIPKDLRELMIKLLEHPAITYIIDLKWKVFGFRLYIEQVLMYALLVMTTTLAVSMDLGQQSSEYVPQLYVWLNVGVAIGIALVSTYFFEYKSMSFWAKTVFIVIAVVLVLVNSFATWIQSHINWSTFGCMNCVVLLLTSLYFVKFEIDELYGEATSDHRICVDRGSIPHWLNRFLFYMTSPIVVIREYMLMLTGNGRALYFASYLNCIQLPTFTALAIFAVFELVNPIASDYRLIIGIVLSFIVWALSIQYLEVHATAGYIIPMMTILVQDIYRFLAFYAPFQCAYTIAYYLLFQDCQKQNSCDASAFSSISQSFITTYLVLLQQFDTNSFDQLEGTQYVVGYILLLTHTTLVMVMLLNVLVAMLTESVESVLKCAKQEALCSFAESVLRSEKTIDIQNVSEYLPGQQAANERTPLLSSPSNAVADEDTIASIAAEMAQLQERMEKLTARMLALQHNSQMN